MKWSNELQSIFEITDKGLSSLKNSDVLTFEELMEIRKVIQKACDRYAK
jgi:hypothetical protein